MRKIKIKIKYILLTALIVIGACAYIVPKAIYARAKELESTDIEASKVLYKRYINMVPFSNRKADAMFKIANQIAPQEEVLGTYAITQFGSSFSGKIITSEIVNNALEYYEEIYKKYPDNEAYTKSYKRLIDIHIALGEHDKSKELIKNELKSENKEMAFIAQKYNMFYLMLEKKYDEAKAIGENLIKQKEQRYIGDVYIMLGDIYFSDMNFEKAIKYYEEQDKERINAANNPSAKIKDYEDFTVYNLESRNLDRQVETQSLNAMKEIYKGKSDIHGKVIINGKPLAFAQIYLRDSRFIALNTFSNADKGYPIWTDAEGNYRFPQLPKGEYDIRLDIPLVLLSENRVVYQNRNRINESIEISESESKEINYSFVPPINIEPKGITEPEGNKVDIKWEKVEGAEYYFVNITTMDDPINLVGSSAIGPISEKIRDTSYTMNIDKLNKQARVVSLSVDGLVSIPAYLGTFFSGFKVPFSVIAYDKEDNIISSSLAIQEKYENLNIISIPKVELLEGDKLLIDKKPEEALKSYEKHLANNPNDVHTMEVLTRMYKLGIGHDWENNKYEGRDLYKAMELANRLYKLTGSIEEVKNVLSHIYTEVNTIKEYQWAVQQILKLPKEEMKMDQYADLGYLYLRLKDFTKAEESFKKATSMGHNYLYEYPLLKLYLEDFDDALVLAQDMEYFMYNGSKNNFIVNLKKIETVDRTSKDYKVFREILGSILSREEGYKEKYKNESYKIEDLILKGLMTEIAKEHNLN